MPKSDNSSKLSVKVKFIEQRNADVNSKFKHDFYTAHSPLVNRGELTAIITCCIHYDAAITPLFLMLTLFLPERFSRLESNKFSSIFRTRHCFFFIYSFDDSVAIWRRSLTTSAERTLIAHVAKHLVHCFSIGEPCASDAVPAPQIDHDNDTLEGSTVRQGWRPPTWTTDDDDNRRPVQSTDGWLAFRSVHSQRSLPYIHTRQ
jgi:hypothetical protein